jgi:hypothetical protein
MAKIRINIKRVSLSENAIEALLFAYDHSDKYHYYNQDAKTKRAIEQLKYFGLVNIDRVLDRFIITTKGMHYVNEHIY